MLNEQTNNNNNNNHVSVVFTCCCVWTRDSRYLMMMVLKSFTLSFCWKINKYNYIRIPSFINNSSSSSSSSPQTFRPLCGWFWIFVRSLSLPDEPSPPAATDTMFRNIIFNILTNMFFFLHFSKEFFFSLKKNILMRLSWLFPDWCSFWCDNYQTFNKS